MSIKRINIPIFGSFYNFIWNESVLNTKNETEDFARMNVLYGRNYSGKTTLSRIIRSLETGVISDKFSDHNFDIYTDSGQTSHHEIPSPDYEIRVYNTDFVEEHLSFLKNDHGNVSAFAVIGRENKKLEEEISNKLIEIGNEENPKSLIGKITTEKNAQRQAQKRYSSADNHLKSLLTNKATNPDNGIKYNPLYKDPNYNTPKIINDIKTISTKSRPLLTQEEIQDKKSYLQQSALPDIKKPLLPTFWIESLIYQVNELVCRQITPTVAIQELLNDAMLQNWVKEGIDLHKPDRKKCGFCGNPLPTDLWEKLGNHFSKESTELEKQIKTLINEVNTEIKNVEQVVIPRAEEFYSSFRQEINTLADELNKKKKLQTRELKKITEILEKRLRDIFTTVDMPDVNDYSETIKSIVEKSHLLIEENNEDTKHLSQNQSKIRTELRLNEIGEFLIDMDYYKEKARVEQLEEESKKFESSINNLSESVEKLSKEIETLRAQISDERKGADLVNKYLAHYFGHDSLKLEAVKSEEDQKFKFEINRNGKPAYNMSEGECSLVSFCYFIAKLQDTETEGKTPIIYIDDPISSLDSNHIFFIYSLIESEIAAPLVDTQGEPLLDEGGKKTYCYKQLFISTHNLEFLKLTQKLSRPKNGYKSFLVQKDDKGSQIRLMPSYLRNYITEFNYLFEQIFICIDDNKIDDNFHAFYGFGNNLRKFLEAFLFYKYPFSESSQQDYNTRVKRFFNTDDTDSPLVQRITNEFSHLGSYVDRAEKPVDSAEISTLARFVLKKIKASDPEQFKCLLESIDKPDPFET